MSSDDIEGERPRSPFHGAASAFSGGGMPSSPLKLDFGVYMGIGMDGGRRSGVDVGLDGGYMGDGDIDNGVARSRTAFVYGGLRMLMNWLSPVATLGGLGKGLSATDANPGEKPGESRNIDIFV